jgi:hypothetical protein
VGPCPRGSGTALSFMPVSGVSIGALRTFLLGGKLVAFLAATVFV